MYRLDVNTFAYGDFPDPLKMYRGKDCAEKFMEHTEHEVKRFYATFSQQPMTELTDVLKREQETTEMCHICLKEFNSPLDRNARDHCHHTAFYRGAAHSNCNLKYQVPHHIPIIFHKVISYDAHLLIIELGKKFKWDYIGVIAENKEKYISYNVEIKVKSAGMCNKDGKKYIKMFSLDL